MAHWYVHGAVVYAPSTRSPAYLRVLSAANPFLRHVLFLSVYLAQLTRHVSTLRRLACDTGAVARAYDLGDVAPPKRRSVSKRCRTGSPARPSSVTTPQRQRRGPRMKLFDPSPAAEASSADSGHASFNVAHAATVCALGRQWARAHVVAPTLASTTGVCICLGLDVLGLIHDAVLSAQGNEADDSDAPSAEAVLFAPASHVHTGFTEFAMAFLRAGMDLGAAVHTAVVRIVVATAFRSARRAQVVSDGHQRELAATWVDAAHHLLHGTPAPLDEVGSRTLIANTLRWLVLAGHRVPGGWLWDTPVDSGTPDQPDTPRLLACHVLDLACVVDHDQFVGSTTEVMVGCVATVHTCSLLTPFGMCACVCIWLACARLR